ncbi:apolipoprotein N-acyltransferase [Aliiroseovarius crassostreae]|uniref:Apolipoprotein N-acyltransferase n=1 Tax=Aliiroseovarius crassostreae TaxID=154981 RepID=A0A0P7JQL0_9RHOB|nr:apolipoprotein N-acyltransferase [Aliiroseovarius crassostreae]KPN63657.1 hypothetical protein AKJ29_13610 [Aliiroseovarius crassostreae]SFU73567.1 apolipoprotein N-acyltransferase [Aliiroseovarius crassostreae]
MRKVLQSVVTRVPLVPLLSGAVAALGQAPFGLWWAMLGGLSAGLFYVLCAASAKQAALRGWFLGLGYFAATLNWLVEPFFVDAARHAWMAPFAVFGLAGGLALFWSLAAGLAFGSRMAQARWMALASALTGAELLRGYVLTGFPWGGPGLAWIDTPLAQIAEVVGVYGLSALSFLVSAGVARAAQLRSGRMFAALAALSALVFVFAVTLPKPPLPDQEIIVRLVQPNAPQHQKWDPRYARDFVLRQLELTRAPAKNGARPDLVLWPETAVPYRLGDTGGLGQAMAEAGQGAPILFGAQRGEGARFFNSLALASPDGKLTPVYDKHHLVPFGEYVPFGDQLAGLGVTAFAAQLGQGYSAGQGADVINLGKAGKVLPLICYEAVFPQDLRAAPERADWILHATNDAWFGNFSGPQQHLAQARFRAIEFGLPMIRVANTGVSAVINAYGEIGQALPLGQSGKIDTKIPGKRAATPYSRHGDLPLTVLVLVALGVFVARRRGKSN